MGETLNLLFRSREDGSYELQVKESWSGRTVSGNFIPPYTDKQLNALHKKLNTLESSGHELRDIGQRLFLALCGTSSLEATGVRRREASEQSVQAMLRSVIQRTLHRRGTVALTFCFTPECDTFVRYPWELLHNGEHFLLASGVFTLTRVLYHPDEPAHNELPVHPPFRMLYMSASPRDFPTLETERSFEAMVRALFDLREDGRIYLDRLEQVTYDQLVSYLSSYGGASVLDDNETSIPCYAVHFDGHGAYGRLCSDEYCQALNEPNARKCAACGASLTRVKPQTYLCFCDEQGDNRYIDTETLSDLFLSSDVRLAVFSACETATFACEPGTSTGNTGTIGVSQRRKVTFDTTLATALVMAQVPAVVAMPYSLQDDLSPTFMFHFYEALAQGRMLEEALARARQALLPRQQKSWFIPVLYRHRGEGELGPVALLADQDEPEEHDHPLAHLGAASTFVGREQELRDLEDLLTAAAQLDDAGGQNGHQKLRPGVHHIALTGPAGIGKSALALEAARRNREKFSGGVIGVSLQGGKSFAEALIEIAHFLHISAKAVQTANPVARARLVLNTLQPLADRGFSCLLVLDGFEEVKEQAEVSAWHRFLCALPRHVVVLLTSRANPSTTAVLEGATCRWYEYNVSKMDNADLLKLFKELATMNGLHDRIHLDDLKQQAILQDICTLLDGYPLGAELIFGTAHTIGGKVFTPEAATRSLEEVCAELRETPLAGIWAVLEVAYLRLQPSARLLLSYLSAFKLPFSHEQIVMLVEPKTPAALRATVRLEREHLLDDVRTDGQELLRQAGTVVPEELAKHWRAARDELVQGSFIQFDGRVYTIHPQVRHFALSYLSEEERRDVHRVMAAYYSSLPQPSPDEWFAAFEHLSGAGEAHDLQTAVHVAMRASWAMQGRGRATELRVMLRRAEGYALQLGDKTGEGQILCCLGAILRQLGQYAEALACLTRSLALHREQQEHDEAGWALYELAMLMREEGHFQQAGSYAQDAIGLFRAVDDSNGEAWMQVTLGEVARGYGRYREALDYFEQALVNFRNLPVDEEGYAWALRNRGTVYEALGRYGEALTAFEEASHLFNTLGLRFRQAWVLADMSAVHANQGEYGLAERKCSESILIFHEQDVRRGEAWALRVMGDIARKQKKVAEAGSYYEKALTIFNDLGGRNDQARVFISLGSISFDEGEYLDAQERYEQALAIAREQGGRPIEGRGLRGLGDVSRVLRRFSEARSYYEQSMNIATELNTPGERCAVLRRQGVLAHAQGQYHNALNYWMQALALDHRLMHSTRKDLQERIETLVREQHLEEEYAKLLREYGLS